MNKIYQNSRKNKIELSGDFAIIIRYLYCIGNNSLIYEIIKDMSDYISFISDGINIMPRLILISINKLGISKLPGNKRIGIVEISQDEKDMISHLKFI